MRTVLRLAAKREAAGKDSTFKIRGRPFELATAEQYLRGRTKPFVSGPGSEREEDFSTDVRCMSLICVPDEGPPLVLVPQDLPDLTHLQRMLVNIPRAVEACAMFAGPSGPIQPARR